MKPLLIFTLSLLCLGVAAPSFRAQSVEDQTVLTQAEQNQVADAGIDADVRIGLYAKFAGDRADRIKRLAERTERNMPRAMDKELENFTSVVDELSSNLDQYGGRMADIRKSLKKLDSAIPKWQELVKSLPANTTYKVSRDDASDSLSDLADQTMQLTQQEEAYFKEHKNAKGQQWEEPK